jgi:DNA-directed RNA polymerase specialized sigma24 family protein
VRIPLRRPSQTRDAVPEADFGSLMERVSRGDQEAFATLYDHTSGPVRDRIQARLIHPDATTTLVAAVCVEVWWLAGCYAGQASDVTGWIHGIAERRLKERRLKERRLKDGRLKDQRPQPTASTERTIEVRELADLLGRSPEELTRQG